MDLRAYVLLLVIPSILMCTGCPTSLTSMTVRIMCPPRRNACLRRILSMLKLTRSSRGMPMIRKCGSSSYWLTS